MRRLLVAISLAALLAIPFFTVPTGAVASDFACPVTLPDGEVAPAAAQYYAQPGHTVHDNGIWVTVPTDGVLRIAPGQILPLNDPEYPGWGSEKLMVLRGDDVEGVVNITGQRLDALSADAPVNDPVVDGAYGEAGFVPIALMIPTAGCWEFTATAGDASLTWVLDVRFDTMDAAPPASPAT